MKIQQRHTAFSRHEEIALKSDSIVRRRDGEVRKSIRYDEIKSIQLVFEGYSQAHEKNVYRCIVRGHGKKLVFSNSLFHDPQPKMDEEYCKIVKELHQRIGPYSDRIQFWQGSTFYHLLAWIMLIFGAILLVLFPALLIFGLTQGNEISFLVRKLWAIALMPMLLGGVALPLLKLGKRKKYNVLELPGMYLPIGIK